MITDLLQLKDHEPPMGDLAVNPFLSEPHALWTKPLQDEPAHPEQRIIHSRTVRLHTPAKLRRLGLRATKGFHNCGSRTNLDWVTAFRVLVYNDGAWSEAAAKRELSRPADGEIDWYDMPDITAQGVLVELRGSGFDGGWVPWALAESACVLEGELLGSLAERCQRTLQTQPIDLDRLPSGVTAKVADGTVEYTTAKYSVGFYLNRAGLSFFSLAGEDPELVKINTLFIQAGFFMQGPQLHLIGQEPACDPFTRFDAVGTTNVKGNTITYDFMTAGQHYSLTWTVTPNGLRLSAQRQSDHDAHAWISSPWMLAMRNSVSPTHAIGRITQSGEAGLLELPMAVNFPRFGTLQFSSESPDATIRFDAYRQRDYNTLEIKLGEHPQPNGTYLLPAGTFHADIEINPISPPKLLRDDAPAEAHAAINRTYYTSLTYRPEMGTLSNNGASMPCGVSMDTWSAFIFGLGYPLANFPAHDLYRATLERWLDGGQGYADGRIIQDGKIHDAQDEYLMTGAAGLLGLADYLKHAGTDEWLQRNLPAIRNRIAAMKARDLDDDGLIESQWRTGLSGTGQWGTNWYDVTSYGWKDALSNAILHQALQGLGKAFAQFGLDEESAELTTWADRLKANYLPTFFNEQTGWLAGWRCKEDKLHDYAFLVVNGCAINAGLVPDDQASDICSRLLAEAEKVGMPDAVYGIPGNLWCIPDKDLADIMQGFAFGFYQNGGRNHSHARHFTMALYRTGFETEADHLLSRMCVGYAEARTFGGNKSGIDWRYWDDRPCGYEGLLTDQFGMLEVILDRYGADSINPAK
jgi:hypothetical protein